MSAERDIRPAALYATDDEIKEAWAVWAQTRVCIHCDKTFNAFESFGARQCHQHSQDTVVDRDDMGERFEKYPCCDKKLPLPYYRRAACLAPNAAVLDSFSASYAYNMPPPQVCPPTGCKRADHTDSAQKWESGVITSEVFNGMILRPVGGWPINSDVVYKESRTKVLSIADAFGMVRIQHNGEPVHVKELAPEIRNQETEGHTWEVLDPETGRVSDKVSYVGGHWRRWSKGVAIADIAGMLPFMMNGNVEQFKFESEIKPFPERDGVLTTVPVVWRIDP